MNFDKYQKTALTNILTAIRNMPRDGSDLPEGLDLDNKDTIAAILSHPSIESALKNLVEDETMGLKTNWNKLKQQNVALRQQAEDAVANGGDDKHAQKVAQAVLDYFDDENEQKLIENNQFDRVIEARTERVNRDWQKKFDILQKDRNTLAETVETRDHTISDGVITRAIQEVLAIHKPHNLAQSTSLLKNEGIVKLDAEGNPLPFKGDEQLVDDNGEAITLQSYVEGYAANNDYQFAKPVGSGQGGGQPASGKTKRSAMSVKEKSGYVETHGQEAFNALPA